MVQVKKTIYIGSDHAGYDLKEVLKKYMAEKQIKFIDLGCFSLESVDYPDIAREVCEKVVEEKNATGVLICGTGIGMMMSANKRPGIRAAVCTHELMAKMARLHNDANVLCLGSRVIGVELAKHILDIFLETEFEDEDRHKRRIAKMEEGKDPKNTRKDSLDDCC
jgi:ribose 5-phosphate isomerase B